MKTLVFILGLALTAPLIADRSTAIQDSSLRTDRQSLRESRIRYRAAVQSHGAQSREAIQARVRLRESRRTFHTHRRAIQG
jgi:hypothetical protein